MDIVERLRKSLEVNPPHLLRNADIAEAANEIERLRAALKYVVGLKSTPIGNTGFAVGPQALLDAAQRKARKAISECKRVERRAAEQSQSDGRGNER